jgi:RecA-family ATPase
MAQENIPHELRSYRQWVRRAADKIPLNPRTGTKADVTDPNTWGTFDEAIASPHGVGVGFVFTDSDPYTGIDLDVKPDEQPTAEQLAIFNEFDSYAEQSPSKRGVHIIVRGKVPTIKRKGIEVYSALRYFTMTGDVLRPGPIADHSAKLQTMWASMGGNASPAAQDAPDAAQTALDGAIIDQARNAANGAKFATLYAGNWQGEYPSQSEADQALINIIGFYSKNREQVARIFRASALGQRDKAKRSDYMNRMLSKAFDRELKPVTINLPNPFVKTEEAAPTLNLSELLHRASSEPETEFTTEYLTPLGDLTLFSANGGVGKTFLALMWLLCIAAGRMFMGFKVVQSSVLFVTAEDRIKECAKRLAEISADMQLLMRNQFTQEAHDNFNLWEILGQPLWIEDKTNAAGVPTLTMIELERRIVATGARQVVIDNASSVFCANHNDNVQVTAFISYLRRMAERTQCNILILAHVSADNATKGAAKTYYGSTAWHNAVRSRLFMELKPAQDGIDEHINVIHEKSNYGKLAEPFKLQRNPETGVLRLLSNREIAQAIDENISSVAEQVFEDIKAICEKGEFINAATQGPSTSYMNLSQHFPNRYKESDRKHKEEVKCAIRKLADDKRIFKRAELMANRSRKEVWVPVLPPISAQPTETLAQPSNAPKHLFAPIRTDSN